MSDINVEFCRRMLSQVHRDVKKHCPNAGNLFKVASVFNSGRGRWEFHGPDNFYWHGRAGNAYDARYKGWTAYLIGKLPYAVVDEETPRGPSVMERFATEAEAVAWIDQQDKEKVHRGGYGIDGPCD